MAQKSGHSLRLRIVFRIIFNKKRGKVLETDSLDDGLIKLVCRIPQVEILEFAIDLRSITQGQGLYDYHFDGYEIVNDDLVERLLKK